MRILLTAINAKYIHSNLAVYSLKGSAGKYEPMTELAEYTINHQMEEIFRRNLPEKAGAFAVFVLYLEPS